MSAWNDYLGMEEFDINNTSAKKTKKKKGEVRTKVTKKKYKVKPMIKRLIRIKCPICFETKESMCSTTCGHVFCTSCIQQTVLLKHKCPICRKTLRGNNTYHRLYLDESNICELVN